MNLIQLTTIDWLTLVGFLLITIGIAIFYSRKNKTLNSYFKAEGKLPWFVAGTAMVATTFAADTPLAVTEIISKDGISGNWVWWYMALGAVVTVFLFAPLWKRSGVLTDLEFLELRYSGLGAKILRGSKAFYLGGMMNIIIIAWVNLAMYKILQAFLDPEIAVFALLFLFSFAFIYTSLLGLGGISYIDVFQFFFAMIGCVLLAYFSLDLPEIGGLQGLQNKLPVEKFNFFPPQQEWSAYLVLVLVLWWTSWYPGSEPGGGGYIAQRIIASKNEIDASKASLWFLFTHYFLRPWPWIIVALCSLVLFPDLNESDKGKGFILMVEPALEKGGKGFVIATFIAAYLSTIATHLNWGASYLVNDLSKPFIWQNQTDDSYLKLSYFLQFLSGLISLYITFNLMDRVSSAWFFIIEASSGIGFALVFRWFWWRITAWSELSGFVAAPIIFAIIKLTTDIQFPFSAGLTAMFTIGIVILVTYLFPSGDRKLLKEFYEKVKPSGLGWKKIASEFQLPRYKSNWLLVFQSCFLAIIGVFSGLSGFGKIFFGTTMEIIVYTIVFFLSLLFLKISITKLYSKSYL